MRELVKKLLYIQYDPLNIVAPSHFITVVARDPSLRYADIEKSFTPSNGIFEGWVRVACFLTVDDYLSLKPEFLRRRSQSLRYGERRRVGPEIEGLAKEALRVIEANGPAMAHDINIWLGLRPKSVGAWRTSVTRTVLNYLWYRGYLVITERLNGQPRFDLTERVIGYAPFTGRYHEYEHEAMLRSTVVRLLDTLLVASPSEIAWFLGQSSSDIRRTLDQLLQSGSIDRVLVGPRRAEYVASSYGLYTVQKHCGQNDSPQPVATILSSFDPLVAHRDRLELLTGVHFRADLFTPVEQRESSRHYPLIMLLDGLPSRILWLRSDRRHERLDLIGSKVLRAKLCWTAAERESVHRLAEFLGLRIGHFDVDVVNHECK